MPEAAVEKKAPKIRRRGRGSQIFIYLGKQLRFFVNQSDWKVIPMAAVIAALVSMVIRKKFFVTMEGSLIGGFALTCVAIWNGAFNSIQSVCRERAIIKREHRSGMHVSSYVAAHMIYQLMLCTAQSGLTVYILMQLGIQFPEKGLITPWMPVDIGISMLLISYASDMLSLFLSSISKTTTGAMTLMPFVLIFQLVFSGGIIPLPEWSRGLSDFTISNYGIRAIAAQSGYNELPMVTVWTTVEGMKDTKVGGSVTLGEILDLASSDAVQKRRDAEIVKSYTVGEVADILNAADQSLHLREKLLTSTFTLREIADEILSAEELKGVRESVIIPETEKTAAVTVGDILTLAVETPEFAAELDKERGRNITLGEVLDALHAEEIIRDHADEKVNPPVTLGAVADFLQNNAFLQSNRDRTFTLETTVGELLDLFGEENVKNFIQDKTGAAAYKPEYDRTAENIISNWLMLGAFVLLFAVLSTLVLEFIDKDKR